MSGLHFLRGATESLFNDRQRAKIIEWEEIKRQQQLDLFKQQTRFRQMVQQESLDYELDAREQATPPQMRQFQGEEGLMQVPSRWNRKKQGFDDFGDPQAVPVVETSKTRKFRQGSDQITEVQMSDGSWKKLGSGPAFAPTSNEQTANSLAVDRRADQRRTDRARRDAINYVTKLAEEDPEQVEKMGGRESAIEKMQRQFLGQDDSTPKGPSIADITPKAMDLANKGARILGLMGADEAADADGTKYKAVDESGKPAVIDAKDQKIAKIMESAEYQRAPIGKTFDVEGEKWVKTERGLEPAGADKAKRPNASIPTGAVVALRQNPSLREEFDAKYGPGAAASVLD